MNKERRDPLIQSERETTGNRRIERTQTKPNRIAKQEVYDAWLRVKSKKGGAGIDGETIEKFEGDLKRNLYKLWNRLSSGSYFPEPVKRVEIPKTGGGSRPLGIPTIKDRVAQEVVRARLEPEVEVMFDMDSYGFRPNRSAHQALEVCRRRCWERNWVLDVDISKFFDTIDHELLLKAVDTHCAEKWMKLYIRRWLTAPVMHADGRVESTTRGTPQGGVISPLLANLFLHYGFDRWMRTKHQNILFERYADDIVIHCQSKKEAERLRQKLEERFAKVKLQLHPEKTQIVYCRDERRTGTYPRVGFTFLGYTFRPRGATRRSDGERFMSYLPAVSTAAQKKLRETIKTRLVLRNPSLTIFEVVSKLEQIVRGWLNYFQRFYPSATRRMLFELNYRLASWLMRKHKINRKRAVHLLVNLRRRHPHFVVLSSIRREG